MIRIFVLISILCLVAIALACTSSETTGGGSTPTEAYKNLYAAVKSKDTEAIKRNLTKKTIGLAEMQSSRAGTPIDVVFANGFTETTYASSLPTIRDERVKGNMGAIEVWNTKNSAWEDLPFIKEDGAWRLAVGDIFSSGYQKPGKGRDEIEKDAANVANPAPPPMTNSNVNRSIPPVAPAPVPSNKK